MEQSTINALLAAARAAKEKAYAPYSGFRVGAAALGESGRIFAGCNVENASYGLSLCAERVAIFKAISEGERRIVAVAVVTDAPDFTDCCGACLQVMAEFSDPDEPVVVLSATETQTRLLPLSQLLPRPFRL